jgi:hypothetical protein
LSRAEKQDKKDAKKRENTADDPSQKKPYPASGRTGGRRFSHGGFEETLGLLPKL